MKWLPIFAKFPNWALAGGIVALSTAIFVGWWMFRGPQSASQTRREPPKEQAKAIDFKPTDVVLCGNTLVNYHTGEILAKEWLEGFGENSPPIVGTFPDEKLVIVESRGSALAFGFDGKAKKPLNFDGKPIGASAFSNERPDVVFVREGNLWRGKPNWVNSTVSEEKRITDVGYFRDNLFSGEYFWAGDDLYVSVMGRPHLVSLADGTVKPDPAPIGRLIRGVSPDRKLAAIGLTSGRFGIAEFATSDLKTFPTVGEVKQVRWLTKDRVAVLGNYRQVSIYDHSKGKMIGEFQLKTQITSLASASPDGKIVLLGTNDGIKFLEVETGKFTPVTLSFTDGAWADNETLLCSNPSTNSEIRGVWLLKIDGSKQHLSDQPIDSGLASGAREPAIEVPSGVLFVSGGNLWHFKRTLENKLTQLTSGQKLVPNLKTLSQ